MTDFNSDKDCVCVSECVCECVCVCVCVCVCEEPVEDS